MALVDSWIAKDARSHIISQQMPFTLSSSSLGADKLQEYCLFFLTQAFENSKNQSYFVSKA
jgi:hypothetical protein